MAVSGTSDGVRAKGALVPVSAALRPWRELPREGAVALIVPERQPGAPLFSTWRPTIPTTLLAAQLLATLSARGVYTHTAQAAAHYRSAHRLACDATSGIQARA